MSDIAIRRDGLTRDSEFSYRCNGCGRCCFGKHIQVNPYEIARMSDGLDIATTEFIDTYLETDGPYLRQADGGACVFFGPEGCSVHPNRPLVCRLYPLGRAVDPDGSERFRELEPDPDTEGTYSTDGLVEGFLAEQDAHAFLNAADAYHRLVDELLGEVGPTGAGAIERFDSVWLDIDLNAGRAGGKAEDVTVEDRMRAHIERIRGQLKPRHRRPTP